MPPVTEVAHVAESEEEGLPREKEEQERAEAEAEEEEAAETPEWLDGEFVRAALGEASPPDELHVERATGKGDNYLSTLFRVRAAFCARQQAIIVKAPPPGEFMQLFVEEVGVFEREATVYAALGQLQAFGDARAGRPLPRLSAAAHAAPRQGTLVLEDLRAAGFAMAERRHQLDLPHSLAVVQALARLHALSVAYDEAHPGFLDRFPDTMYAECNRARLDQFVPQQFRSLAAAAATWPGCEAQAAKVLALVPTAVDRLLDSVRRIEGERRVLLHGDCWVNNIMFRAARGDGGGAEALPDVRFVDFQLSNAASPALDLLYFLYSSPRADVRRAHEGDLIERYCSVFARVGAAVGMRAAPPGTEEIRAAVRRHLYFGFASAAMTLAVVLAEPENTIDLEKVTVEEAETGTVDAFGDTYVTERFQAAFSELLPLFDRHGVLD